MNKGSLTVTVMAGMLCSACVPMEQAALTYTSKSTIGVGLEAGTAETPGLDVTIGFKESNAALVPVAVAKFCYKARGAECQNAIYQMALIQGGKEDVVENGPVQSRLEEIAATLNKLNQDQARETEQLANLRAKVAVAEAAQSAQDELDNMGTASVQDTPEITSRRSELTAKAQSAPDGFNLGNAIQQTAALENTRTERTQKIETFLEERKSLTTQLESNSASGRTDAFSVYGRFSGQANGTGQGASLTAGKVFATGIAAQNLTELGVASNCLASIQSLAEMLDAETQAADRAKLLGSAGEICARQS